MPLAQPDTDILEWLDFEPLLPCEAEPPWHKTHGTGPADWLVRVRCPGCNHTQILAMCDGCWQAGLKHWNRKSTCTECGHEGPLSDWLTVLSRI